MKTCQVSKYSNLTGLRKKVGANSPLCPSDRYAVPQMSKSTKFGGGEYNIGMFIFIYAKVEVVLTAHFVRVRYAVPHFRPTVLRGMQMGERPKAGRMGQICHANPEAIPRPNTHSAYFCYIWHAKCIHHVNPL